VATVASAVVMRFMGPYVCGEGARVWRECVRYIAQANAAVATVNAVREGHAVVTELSANPGADAGEFYFAPSGI
jgi:hypothetical protein